MKTNSYIKKIVAIFNAQEDMRSAHRLIEPILQEMTANQEFINQAIEFNLSDPLFLERKRHYPTLALSIFKNDLIDIIINIFPNLPDKNTNISFQSIHHHGNLMLSTIGLSGVGYTSFIFNNSYSIEESTKKTNLKIDKQYQNKIGQYTFCDGFTPHIVFYPESFSSTLVVWSRSDKKNINKLKSLFPKPLKKSISKMATAIGLKKTLAINAAQYHDFYPENNQIIALKDRIDYPEGSNTNFIQNIFHYFQSVGYYNEEYLNKLLQKNSSETAKKWIQKFIAKERIDPEFESIHLNISNKVNIIKESIINACK